MTMQLQIDPLSMRDIMGRFCTGITVITGHDGVEPIGFTCQSFMSLSLEPALIAVSPSRSSSSWRRIREKGSFTVNILSGDQEHVSRTFGRPGQDKFAGLEWSYGTTGAPRLDRSAAWIDCTISAEHDGGDHTLVIGQVRAMEAPHDTPPLLFNRGGYAQLALAAV